MCVKALVLGSQTEIQVFLSDFRPAAPVARDPFGHKGFIFELKHESFRALGPRHVEPLRPNPFQRRKPRCSGFLV